MNDKQFSRWEKRRKLGILRFVLFFGLLWTILFDLLYYGSQIVVPEISSIKRQDFMFTFEGFIFFVSISILGGWFVFAGLWVVNESQYKSIKLSRGNSLLK